MLVTRRANTSRRFILEYLEYQQRDTSLVTYNDAFNDELRGDKPPLLAMRAALILSVNE